MLNNYQSIYTGEEIDRGIGFANNTLCCLQTVAFALAFSNISVGITGTAPTAFFSRLPMVGNKFSGIGIATEDSRSFTFSATVTTVVSGGNVTFQLDEVRDILTANPFLGMLSPIDSITNMSFVKNKDTSPSLKFNWAWADNAVYFVTVKERYDNGGVISEGPVASSGIIVTSSAAQRLYIPCDADFGFLISLYADKEAGAAVTKKVVCEARTYDGFPVGLPINGFRVSFRRLV